MIRTFVVMNLGLMIAACGFEGAEGTGSAVENGGGDPGSGTGGTGPGSGGQAADTDKDGVNDPSDNCVTTANAEQYDEDADHVGDACDNCPHIANADQLEVGEVNAGASKDGIGDACDPNPTLGGDKLALFLGFNKTTDFAGWQVAGEQDFAIAGGKLQNRKTTDLALAWNNELDLRDAILVTQVRYLTLSTTYRYRGVAIVGRFNRAANLGTGIGCGEMRDANVSTTPFRNGVEYNGQAFNNQGFGNSALAAGSVAVYTARLTATGVTCVTGVTGTQSFSRTSSISGTGAALSVWGAAADIDYLVAYKR